MAQRVQKRVAGKLGSDSTTLRTMIDVCHDRGIRHVFQLAQAVGVQQVSRWMSRGVGFHGTVLATREKSVSKAASQERERPENAVASARSPGRSRSQLAVAAAATRESLPTVTTSHENGDYSRKKSLSSRKRFMMRDLA